MGGGGPFGKGIEIRDCVGNDYEVTEENA